MRGIRQRCLPQLFPRPFSHKNTRKSYFQKPDFRKRENEFRILVVSWRFCILVAASAGCNLQDSLRESTPNARSKMHWIASLNRFETVQQVRKKAFKWCLHAHRGMQRANRDRKKHRTFGSAKKEHEHATLCTHNRWNRREFAEQAHFY